MCRCTGWAFPRCAYVLPTYRACTSILPVPTFGATLETKGPGAARGLMHLPNRTLYTHARTLGRQQAGSHGTAAAASSIGQRQIELP